ILNGADYAEWNPAIDSMVATSYSPNRPDGKRYCKRDLLREAGLPLREDVPALGMVSRMTSQKGFELIRDAFDAMMAMDLQVVIVASGDAKMEEFFREGEGRYPEKFRLLPQFDNTMAHKIQAGSDVFLMPSRFEPCGLTQMYAMKYGTAPLVRATGGLRDTIAEFDASRGTGNGFMFEEYRAEAMVEALARACNLFSDRARWQRLVDNCFAADFSWAVSARNYLRWFDDLRRTRTA